MTRPSSGWRVAVALCACACSSSRTVYSPHVVAPSELTLTYDHGLEMSAGGRTVARGHEYAGLEPFVACVPAARDEAREAETDGAAGTRMTIAGGIVGVAGLGGLAGLAYVDDAPEAAAATFATGIGVAVTGLVLAAVGRSYKSKAHGHAIDAMNYYNDAVGSAGGACAPAAR